IRRSFREGLGHAAVPSTAPSKTPGPQNPRSQLTAEATARVVLIGGGAMKKLFVILGVCFVFGVCFHFLNPPSSGISDDEGGGIPLPAGQFSITAQGSLAVCLNPTSFAEEPCSTAGALVFRVSILDNGAGTGDKTGNSCFTFTEDDSSLPLGASPPTVAVLHSVGKLLNYHPTTGTVDASFTIHSGGHCNGVAFDKTGATQVNGGTDHFVVTDGGKRIDFLLTSFTNPAIGDFSLSGTELRQQPED